MRAIHLRDFCAFARSKEGPRGVDCNCLVRFVVVRHHLRGEISLYKEVGRWRICYLTRPYNALNFSKV